MEPLIKSHVTATVSWALTETRSEERRVLIAQRFMRDVIGGP